MQTANAKFFVARSSSTISKSMALIAASTCSMVRPFKRPPYPIRGGSATEFDSAWHHLRARILCFVNATELPRIVAGYATETKPCDVCKKGIARGAPEYEVGFSGFSFRLDAECYALWTDEMLRSNAQSKSA